ncbi:hypothetical protein HDV02_006097 [Globomyces sp. JEL0801]|nr:hypothetical protein HDV02_006097 [Globomyces sp. JEL0801]
MFVCTLKLDHNLSKKHSFTITDALVSCRRSTNDVPMLLIKSNTRTISYSLKENHLRISPMNMKGEFYFRSTHANGKINLIRQTESIEPLHRILSTLNNIGFDVKTLELYDENLPIEKPLVVVDKSVPFVSKANDTIAKPFPLKSIDCNAMTAKNVVDIDLTGTDIKSKVLQPNLSTTSIDSNRTMKRKAHIDLTCIEDEPTEKILQQVVPSIPLYAGMAVDKRSKRLAISQRELQNLNFYLNQPSSNSDYNVEGIPNIGQTCYIAVILQMLYHSNVRKKLLSSREWVRSVLGNNTIYELVCDIFQRKLNRKAISLSGLQNQISNVCKRFKKSEQEDAHEFLITLLDQLSLCTIIRQDGDISLNDLRKKDPVNEFEFSMKV